MKEVDAMKALGGVIKGDAKEGYHAYKDNGSKILAVAHLDNVCHPKWFATDAKAGVVFSPVLDDRLGLYTVLHYLPNVGGITYDVLLTTGEESGKSTAQHFKPDKQYNWIVEFDRKGTDVAYYDFDGDGFKETLGLLFETSRGSFTDICKMESLGAKAFNVGVGYHDEHQVNSYMKIGEYIIQMARFVLFYQMYKDTHFAHKEKPSYCPQYAGYGAVWHNGGRLYDDGEYLWDGYYQAFVPKTMARQVASSVQPDNGRKLWVDGYGWLHVKEDPNKKGTKEVFVSGLGWVSEATAKQVEEVRKKTREKLLHKNGNRPYDRLAPVISTVVHELPKEVPSDTEFITGVSDDKELDALTEEMQEGADELEKELGLSDTEDEDELILMCKCGATFFRSQAIASVCGLPMCPECGRYLEFFDSASNYE